MARKDVFVIERWDDIVVTPAIQPAAHGGGGDQVFFTNLTSGDIVIFVAEGVFTQPAGAGNPPNHVAKTIPAGQSDFLQVFGGPGNMAGRHVAYAVYCRGANRFAKGASDPEIIIT